MTDNVNLLVYKARRLDNHEWIIGTSIVVFIDDDELLAYMPSANTTCTAIHDENDNIQSIEGMMYQIDYSSLEVYSNELVEVDDEEEERLLS